MSKRTSIALILLLGSSPSLYAAEATTSAPATQPVNLLKPRQTDEELRAHLLPLVPKFEIPKDVSVWMSEAEKLRKRVIEEVVLRGVPEKWYKHPTKPVWGDTVEGKGYKIRKLRYEIVPGYWAGALLYEPDNLKSLVPAILNVNGHVGAEGMTIAYEQIRRINLAKRGMLALALEWTGMGELSPPEYDHHGACFLELCGISGVSIHYLALKRGVDILLENEHADPDRVAVTGLSGGGWQTIFISALDTRVKLAAPNAGYMGNATRINVNNDLGDEEQSPVDLGLVCDYLHLTAMLAPRPALLLANANDACCFRADRVKAHLYEPIKPIYELLGKPERFEFHEDPGGHNYDKGNREAFYKFLNRHFLPEDQRKDDEIAVDDEVRKQAELAIDYPKENSSYFKLAVEAMKSLPETKKPGTLDRTSLADWRKKTREELRKVIRLPANNSPKYSGLPSDIQFPAGKDIEARTSLLRVNDEWTLPVVELMVAGSQPTLNKLIICDKGRELVADLVKEQLNQEQRVYLVDILSTGECASQWNSSPYSWLWTLMTAELGERTLGLQVMQLKAVSSWIKSKHPTLAIHALTRHRVSGMAALVYAAVFPGDLAVVKMDDMDETLKVLMDKQVNTLQTQPIYCTGLLKVADIPELMDLANPTRAEFDH